MTSMERTLATVAFREPDRVPCFLLFATYGAKALELAIDEYFSRPEYVAEGQLRLLKKFGGDCLNAFHYASIEIEAFGGATVYYDDGPPNAAAPIITDRSQIWGLEEPVIGDSPGLLRVLETIRLLRQKAGADVPVIGNIIAPFSLPIMQMGFESYLELLYFHKKEFERLMQVNAAFSRKWANAQFKAGADIVLYFDPMASPSILERSTYLNTGHPVACDTVRAIRGPVVTGLASGRSEPVADDIAETGSAGIGFSSEDDIQRLKDKTYGRLCLIGNLNGVEMVRWSRKQARDRVRTLIAQAGPGGGFILCDNHGEIPYQVPEDILLEIVDANRAYGTYPIKAGQE